MRRALGDGTVWLREADESDLPALQRGLSDPDVVRWLGAVTASAAEVLVLNRERWRDLTGPTFAIRDAATDAFVGLVWVNRSLSDPSTGALGYWLLPEARGRGLASRAVRLMSDWALVDLGVGRLRLLTEAGNAASQAVARRSGFQPTGERRPGTLFDGREVEYLVHEAVDSGPARSSPS